VAAIAALILMNKSGDTSSLLGGSGSGDLWGGGSPTYGSDAPIIYQIPAEGGVTFPSGGGLSLEDFMSLFQAAPDTGGAKKESSVPDYNLDAGAVLPSGRVLQRPFVSTIPSKKEVVTKETVAPQGTPGQTWNPLASVGAGFAANPAMAPVGLGLVAMTALSGLFMQKSPEENNRFGGFSTWGGSQLSLDTVRAPAGTVSVKKGSDVSGYSGQYIRDPLTGLFAWNPDNGFGLSKDPKTGMIGAYQRDVDIYGPSGKVYDAGTKKGNAMIAADARQETYTTNPGADISASAQRAINAVLANPSPEVKKVASQPTYSPSPSRGVEQPSDDRGPSSSYGNSSGNSSHSTSSSIGSSSSYSTSSYGGSGGWGGGGAGGR
jgi:hypothetical protein